MFRWATLPYPGNGQVVLGFLVLLGFNVLFAIIASSLIALEVSHMTGFEQSDWSIGQMTGFEQSDWSISHMNGYE